MTIGFSGESQPASNLEKVTIDNATEDLIITITGTGSFQLTPNWTSIPPLAQRTAGLEPQKLRFQIGEEGSDLNQIEIELMDLQAQSLGLDTLDISADGAKAAITALDSTMTTVEGHQAKYAAYENTIGRAIEQADTRRVQEKALISVFQKMLILQKAVQHWHVLKSGLIQLLPASNQQIISKNSTNSW